MLVFEPEVVRFEEVVIEDALGVSVDRQAERLIEEWSDDGPYAAMVDVPERRVTVRVVRRPSRGPVEAGADADAGLAIGREGDLLFYASTGGTDAGRMRVRVRCVLVGIKSELSVDNAARASGTRAPGVTAVQTLTFIGVSPNGGASDPVSFAAAVLGD